MKLFEGTEHADYYDLMKINIILGEIFHRQQMEECFAHRIKVHDIMMSVKKELDALKVRIFDRWLAQDDEDCES